MPIVRVDFWEGVGVEKVKTMIRGITKVIADLGVPEQAVEVILYEILGVNAARVRDEKSGFELLELGLNPSR